MITEDQLEQLAIQWFQDTGWNHFSGVAITPEVVVAEREALRTLTPALSHVEKEEDGRLAEVRLRVATPGRVVHEVTNQGFRKERGKLLNKERRYPIALTMRGPLGSGLPRFMGIPWARRIGMQGERSRVILVRIAHTAWPKAIRRSLGMVSVGCGRRRRPTIKSNLMVRFGAGGSATCKGCLHVRLERKQKP
jgi:hypothetical protein